MPILPSVAVERDEVPPGRRRRIVRTAVRIAPQDAKAVLHQHAAYRREADAGLEFSARRVTEQRDAEEGAVRGRHERRGGDDGIQTFRIFARRQKGPAVFEEGDERPCAAVPQGSGDFHPLVGDDVGEGRGSAGGGGGVSRERRRRRRATSPPERVVEIDRAVALARFIVFGFVFGFGCHLRRRQSLDCDRESHGQSQPLPGNRSEESVP
mmetsp:Transcript_10128/g.29946  ORF Transcript_10128/g.29946 Transcript_10128/m.29946 type:complete len:210 (-) Transcript_10128:183-812(-)